MQTGLANKAQMALGWEADQGSWSLQIQDFVFGGFTPYVQVYGLRNEVVGVPDGYEDPMYVYMSQPM